MTCLTPIVRKQLIIITINYYNNQIKGAVTIKWLDKKRKGAVQKRVPCVTVMSSEPKKRFAVCEFRTLAFVVRTARFNHSAKHHPQSFLVYK